MDEASLVKTSQVDLLNQMTQIIQMSNLQSKDSLLLKISELFHQNSQPSSRKNLTEDKLNQESILNLQSNSSLQKVFSQQINLITKITTKICQTIVQIASTQKLYHIRQNFRKLALQILNLENAEFYVFHDSGRIEYHDFKQNYITQLLQENDKRKNIQYILANTSQTVQNVHLCFKQQGLQNSKKCELFSKLFNVKKQPLNRIGQINKLNQKYSILSLFTFPQCVNVSQINEKIIQKLILISMIQVQEQSEYDIVQLYSKELLDILNLLLGQSQQKIKNSLKKLLVEDKTINFAKMSLNQIIKTCFKDTQLQFLSTESLKYQQFRYDLLQKVRMYSKYLCQDNVMFMDFDQQGKLFFLSNNRKNSQLQSLLSKLALTGDLCIEKIFTNNLTLQQHIKKSLGGQSKNKKLYEIQNGMKARVTRNQFNQIQRIMIVIEDPSLSQSFGSFSSSTLQGMSSKKKKKGSCNSDSVSIGKQKKSTNSLLKSIQKQNPGISQNGWLNLFIKDHELKRNNSSVMTKKKQTLFARSEQGQNSISSLNQLIDFDSSELLKKIDIFSPDTNLLELEPQSLQPFVKKVFSQLKYFKSFEYNKEHFDNFLFHLHEGYSIHDNPFHNFMHGVNVMHTCFLICNIPGNQQILNPLKVFSTVLSGLCHDVGHTGRTNSFEIASRSKKALTYNDLSPLQNFHASFTFEILRRPQNNFLQKLSLQDYNQIRKDIISNILYTDIKEHFPLIKKFKAIQFKPEEGKLLSAQDTRVLTGMITHTSDFGGSAKEFQICREWSRRVNIEFSSQYKQQQLMGLPQTPFFKDLQVESIMAKNEMGFLKVIVFPLYQVLNQFYKDEGTLKKLKIYAEQNIKQWQKVHLNCNNVNNEETKKEN